MGLEQLNGRLGLRMAVWLQAEVRERGLGLRLRLDDGPVCDAQRCCGGLCGLRRCKSAMPVYLYCRSSRISRTCSVTPRRRIGWRRRATSVDSVSRRFRRHSSSLSTRSCTPTCASIRVPTATKRSSSCRMFSSISASTPVCLSPAPVCLVSIYLLATHQLEYYE